MRVIIANEKRNLAAVGHALWECHKVPFVKSMKFTNTRTGKIWYNIRHNDFNGVSRGEVA